LKNKLIVSIAFFILASVPILGAELLSFSYGENGDSWVKALKTDFEQGQTIDIDIGRVVDGEYLIKTRTIHPSGNISLMLEALDGSNAQSLITITSEQLVLGHLKNGENSLVFTPGNKGASSVKVISNTTLVKDIVVPSVIEGTKADKQSNTDNKTPQKNTQSMNDVRVVFGYSESIAQEYNSDETLTALFDNYVAEFNNAASASGIDISLSHGGGIETNIDENFQNNAILTRMSSFGTSYVDSFSDVNDATMTLEDLRLQQKAHVAVQLTPFDNGSICGAGFIGGTQSGTQCPDSEECFKTELGYASVDLGPQCLAAFSFGHEIGHIFGLGHNLEASTNISAYDDGHGYLYETSTPKGTIMATAIGTNKFLSFSSPELMCEGFVCGDAAKANSASAITRKASSVMGYINGGLEQDTRFDADNPLLIFKDAEFSAVAFIANGLTGVSFTTELLSASDEVLFSGIGPALGSNNRRSVGMTVGNVGVTGLSRVRLTSVVDPSLTVTVDNVFVVGGAPDTGQVSITSVNHNTANFSVSTNGQGMNVNVEYTATGSSGDVVSGSGQLAATYEGVSEGIVEITGLVCESDYVMDVELSNYDGSLDIGNVMFSTNACPVGEAPDVIDVTEALVDGELNVEVALNGMDAEVSGTYQVDGGAVVSFSPISVVDTGSEANTVVLSIPVLACENSVTGVVTAENNIGSDELAFDFTTRACNAGTIGFTQSAISVNESSGSVTLFVERLEGLDGDVSATLDVALYSASSSDITYGSLEVNFADGDGSSQTVTININDDSADENNEVFTVSVGAITGGANLGQSDVIVTIVDNDTMTNGGSDGGSGGGSIGVFILMLILITRLHAHRKVVHTWEVYDEMV